MRLFGKRLFCFYEIWIGYYREGIENKKEFFEIKYMIVVENFNWGIGR